MKKSVIHFFTVAVAIVLVFQGFQLMALGQNLAGVTISSQPTSTVKREYINPKTLYSGIDYGFSQAVATQGKKIIYLSG